MAKCKQNTLIDGSLILFCVCLNSTDNVVIFFDYSILRGFSSSYLTQRIPSITSSAVEFSQDFPGVF